MAIHAQWAHGTSLLMHWPMSINAKNSEPFILDSGLALRAIGVRLPAHSSTGTTKLSMI